MNHSPNTTCSDPLAQNQEHGLSIAKQMKKKSEENSLIKEMEREKKLRMKLLVLFINFTWSVRLTSFI